MDFNEILKRDDEFRYQLLSRMKSDCNYYLGNGGRHPKHLWAENEVEQIAYMKALWNSFDDKDKPEWLTMEQILEYEQKIGIKAILVEMDYKGYYERFALTPEEFEKEFPKTYKHFSPIEESNSDTLKPMVHIWFEPCVVGDGSWVRHFTDMECGLPESDVESGNLAYVDFNQVQSLEEHVFKTIYPYLSQCSDFEAIRESFSDDTLASIEQNIKLYEETDMLVFDEESGELYHKNGEDYFHDAVVWYAGLIDTKDFILSFGDRRDLCAKQPLEKQIRDANLEKGSELNDIKNIEKER